LRWKVAIFSHRKTQIANRDAKNFNFAPVLQNGEYAVPSFVLFVSVKENFSGKKRIFQQTKIYGWDS